jgi:tripartite-type tricarboxylate transporter receptor subunit TctC
MMRAIPLLRVLGILAVLTAAPMAQAQTDFPNRPVTIIVPFAAGGPTDVLCRMLADELAKVWKQQVVVENKPGGGTVIGTALVARAKPDGYMIAQVSGSFIVNAGARPNLPYDSLKDFKGVSVFIQGPLAIVAHPGFPANTLPELIEEARKREARPFTFASAGVGSPAHLAGEIIQRKANIKLAHISYSGEAAAVSDILSGRVDFQIGTWASWRPHVEQGKLKLISILYPKRLPEAPNTPTAVETIKDLGLPLNVFNALAVPSGVPADVLAKISEGVKAAVESKTFREKVLALGAYPHYTTPEETDAYIRNEIAIYTEITKAAGIRLE